MPISEYVRRMGARGGTDLVLMPSVSLLAFDDRGRVLLVRHAETGRWVIPGGTVEPLESPADAAVRGVWEGAGIRVELTRVVGVCGGPEFHIRCRNGDEVAVVIAVFEGRPLP